MSFAIPDHEKKVALEGVKAFQSVINQLKLAKEYLSNIYDPFKKAKDLDTDKLVEKRGRLAQFTREVEEKFNKVKYSAFLALDKLMFFGVDTKSEELRSAFQETVDDLSNSIDIFVTVMDEFKSPEFKEKVLVSIDNINKECAQVEIVIKERILDYLNSDILSNNWVSHISDEKKLVIKEKEPLLMELQKEQLDPSATGIDQAKREQIMNPLDAQNVTYPADRRNQTYLINT